MRIIGGSARGKRLVTFDGTDIRPTPDRVREALFSILISRRGSLEGFRVLDLFAGTGALGAEALSRGAETALFVDQRDQSCSTIRENLANCRLAGKGTVRKGDVLQVLPTLANASPFDLIFLDPPYGRDLVPQVLKKISSLGILAAGGIVCAEAARKDVVPPEFEGLVRVDERHYGLTTLHFYIGDETGND